MEHGLAFCRAVYHTSPMGDVVPVEGGLDAGPARHHRRPRPVDADRRCPWEPDAAWCLGDAFTPDGAPAPEAPRHVVRRVAERLAGARATSWPVVGPELEFYLLRAGAGRPLAAVRRRARATSTWSAARATREGLLLHMLRQLRDAGLRVTAANHEFSPRPVRDQPGPLRAWSTPPTGRSGSSPRCRRSPASEGLLATFMAKPFNDEGGSGFHVHVSLVDEDGAQRLRRPRRAGRPVRRSAGTRSAGCSRTRRR